MAWTATATATAGRASAGLRAFLTGPSGRRVERVCCRRTIASSTRTWQQSAQATAPNATSPLRNSPSPSPTPAPSVSPPAPLARPAAVNSTRDLAQSTPAEPSRSLTDSLAEAPPVLNEGERQVDWTRSYHGLSSAPFTAEQAAILQQELKYDDVEIKPDGIIYLPEIKYRRILNKAFGPGGWGLAPRGETIVTGKVVTREYGLVAGGRLISIARGEQQYFDPDGIPTATEGCKSNALMRCCKDLGIASELWDPRYIRKFMAAAGKEVIVEHLVTKKRKRQWMRKDDGVRYPFKEVPQQHSSSAAGAAAGFR